MPYYNGISIGSIRISKDANVVIDGVRYKGKGHVMERPKVHRAVNKPNAEALRRCITSAEFKRLIRKLNMKEMKVMLLEQGEAIEKRAMRYDLEEQLENCMFKQPIQAIRERQPIRASQAIREMREREARQAMVARVAMREREARELKEALEAVAAMEARESEESSSDEESSEEEESSSDEESSEEEEEEEERKDEEVEEEEEEVGPGEDEVEERKDEEDEEDVEPDENGYYD